MARVSLSSCVRVGACTAVMFALWAPIAQAAPNDRREEPSVIVPDVPDGRRSYAQSAFTKLRQGYNLAGPEQMPPATDYRGEMAIKRDLLVQQHYSHLACVDAISDAAVRNHDISTAERAEALRRRDIQNFMLAMQNLRRILLRQQAAVGP